MITRRPTRPRSLRRFLPALLFVGAAGVMASSGCLSVASDSGTTLSPTDTSVSGVYNLQTVGGTFLPVVGQVTETQEFDITADQLTIGTDTSWTETTSYSVTDLTTGSQSAQQTVVSGGYVIVNGVIDFTTSVGGTAVFTGSVTGGTLNLLFNGTLFVYTK
jgi:hypothetical protein